MPALTMEFKDWFRREWVNTIALTEYLMCVCGVESIPIAPKIVKDEEDEEDVEGSS